MIVEVNISVNDKGDIQINTTKGLSTITVVGLLELAKNIILNGKKEETQPNAPTPKDEIVSE